MMKFRPIFLAANFLVVFFPAPQIALAGNVAAGPSAPVLLKPRALIDDDVVRLGDLFDGLESQGQTAVARAPEPGRRVDVGARWLAAVAKAYALVWQPRSKFDTLTIERASLLIDTTQIENATIDALAAKGATGRISVLFDNPALRLHLPTDATPSIAIAGLSYDPASGRFVGQIVAPAEGTPVVRATISGRAIEMTEIPVLSRRLEPGEVIARKDIQWVSVRAGQLSRNTVVDQDRLLGKSSRRPLRAGEAVLSADLREPILVEKNSIVTIRLDHPRMMLTAQGRALDQGAAGDAIRVMNTKSKTVVNATVASSGEVLVLAAAFADTVQEGQK